MMRRIKPGQSYKKNLYPPRERTKYERASKLSAIHKKKMKLGVPYDDGVYYYVKAKRNKFVKIHESEEKFLNPLGKLPRRLTPAEIKARGGLGTIKGGIDRMQFSYRVVTIYGWFKIYAPPPSYMTLSPEKKKKKKSGIRASAPPVCRKKKCTKAQLLAAPGAKKIKGRHKMKKSVLFNKICKKKSKSAAAASITIDKLKKIALAKVRKMKKASLKRFVKM